MTKIKSGDYVQIATREQTPQDGKSGLYFNHYGGLRGSILKVYGEEASVLVDRDTLPAEIRVRHEEGETAMRRKWLDGLSDEARNRLGDKEKQFALNYAVLVSIADLAPAKAPKRLTEADLEAREAEFLTQRKTRGNGSR